MNLNSMKIGSEIFNMNMKFGPIKPDEVEASKMLSIPEEVFQAFNELIVKNYRQKSSTVRQSEVLKLATDKLSKLPQYQDLEIEKIKNIIFTEGWLDVEATYRAAGWKVEYDMTDWNVGGESFFEFSKPKPKG